MNRGPVYIWAHFSNNFPIVNQNGCKCELTVNPFVTIISLGNPLTSFTEESGQLTPQKHAVQYSPPIQRDITQRWNSDLLRTCYELFGWNSLCKISRQIQNISCIVTSSGSGFLNWAKMGVFNGKFWTSVVNNNKLVLWPHVIWIRVGSLRGLLSIRVLQHCQNNMTSPYMCG